MPAMSTPAGRPEVSLTELYPPLAPALHAWACVRLGPLDRSRVAPEDLTQEIWLRANQVFASFDPARCSFRAWLFAVAKNVLLEVRRRLRRSGPEWAAQATTRQAALARIPYEITSIATRLANDEHVRRFVDRIGTLDDEDRQTVLHCGLEGLSLQEASTRLGETRAATTKRWQRLRGRIATWGGPLGMLDEE
jgi:RNA polymerase sigma-70 factor (ECF subfamily)